MSNTQLAIQISKSAVHVAELLISSKEIVNQYDFDLYESDNGGYRKQLKEGFSKITLAEEYKEYTLAWATPKQTLVPFKVYNESSAQAIYELLFGNKIDNKTVDFNRLMELSLVSVFEIPDWVKAFFIIHFPKIIIKHENTITLRALFQGATFKRKIVVSFSEEYVNINIIFHNELQFSNSFTYQKNEDIMYHLLFVIQKEKINNKDGEILFLFTSNSTEKRVEELITLLEKHKPIKEMGKISSSSVLKLHPLCV